MSASPAVFYNTSNMEVPGAYSTEPYAHWASYHYQQASASGYECVLAVGSYAYDTFTGNPESRAHLGNNSLYQRTNDNKYGWAICPLTHPNALPCPSLNLDSSLARRRSTLTLPCSWASAVCTGKFHGLCATPMATYPCFPPPLPPPPPPLPPSPPLPPLPPSCAPPPNTTFFCVATSCYLLGPALPYDQAAAACAAAAPGASLAVCTSAEEQLGVELYFR